MTPEEATRNDCSRCERVQTRGRHTVALTPNANQSEADVERDFANSFRYGEQLTERDVDEYRSALRWRGPVKVMVSKEVGPPPWPWPKVKFNLSRRPEWFLSLGVGWRSTLYSLHIMWTGRAS